MELYEHQQRMLDMLVEQSKVATDVPVGLGKGGITIPVRDDVLSREGWQPGGPEQFMSRIKRHADAPVFFMPVTNRPDVGERSALTSGRSPTMNLCFESSYGRFNKTLSQAPVSSAGVLDEEPVKKAKPSSLLMRLIHNMDQK